MAVYVDEARWPYGRMIMCHMIADTHAELVAMADKIGVARKWIQYPGRVFWEHFDICKAKRAQAIAAGAVEMDAEAFASVWDKPDRKQTYYATEEPAHA